MRLLTMRPPRIALLLTVLAAAVHRASHRGEPVRFFLPLTGTFVGTAGFALMMWSWRIFKQEDLAICPLQATAHITSAGPYRFSRNPMYLGIFLMLLGLALFIGTLPFTLSAFGYFAIMHFIFCPYEESKLGHAFGSDYAQYRSRVRRWL